MSTRYRAVLLLSEYFSHPDELGTSGVQIIEAVLYTPLFVYFSMQLAEEVLKSGPSPGEGEAVNSPAFEGMEALARAIELGECVLV